LAKKARVWTGTEFVELASAQTDLTAYSTTAQMDTAITAGVGLVPILTQTIGSAVSSVVVSNAFSATYDAYKIIISNGVSSADGVLKLSLTGGTSVYSYSVPKTTYLSTNLAAAIGGPTETSWVVAGSSTTSRLSMNVDLLDPFLAKFTTYSGGYVSSIEAGAGGGIHKEATSFTGFTITQSTGTITGGTIRVYGYKN